MTARLRQSFSPNVMMHVLDPHRRIQAKFTDPQFTHDKWGPGKCAFSGARKGFILSNPGYVDVTD